MSRRGHAPNHSPHRYAQAARTMGVDGLARPLIDTTDRPRQVPPLSLRSVPCTACGAGVGEPCHSAAGLALSAGHRARRRAAARKSNEERGI